MWPRLFIIGMRIFARIFARVPASQSWLFNFSKSSFTWFSRVKTFTTFCPSIISSIKPFTAPKLCCCALKAFPLCFPIFPVRKTIKTSIKITIQVKIGERKSINTKDEITVNKEFIICGKAWLIISRKVSVSFVYKLIISPWEWVSK